MSGESRGVRIVHVGLGQIGTQLAKLTAEKAGLEGVAAVDPSPERVGCSLAEVAGAGSDAVKVAADLDAALAQCDGADVAFHAVASDMATIEGQFSELIDRGLNVITTAEELIFPYGAAPDAAARIDDRAKKNGVTVFAAGINPGFLMDRLPAYVSSVCVSVDSVDVTRLVDLGTRRQALRQKMGVGQSLGAIGHVGLRESLDYLADALGWELAEVRHDLAPVVAEQRVEKAGEVVEPGQVLGMAENAEAETTDGRRLSLSLTMRLDAEEPYDEVRIAGVPPIVLRFSSGVAGDQATAATVMNAARYVAEAPAGLIARLPLPAGS
jgi:4-hydroxy-tetrahydrodipicolinate reductase